MFLKCSLSASVLKSGFQAEESGPSLNSGMQTPRLFRITVQPKSHREVVPSSKVKTAPQPFLSKSDRFQIQIEQIKQ